MENKYNNCVIKNLNEAFANKMIQWWKDQGVNTGLNYGYNTEENSNNWCYYGLHNGSFDSFSLDKVNRLNLKVIELPIYNLGEKVLVKYRESDKLKKRIYLFTKDNIHYCVNLNQEHSFINNNNYMVGPWKFIEKLPIISETELKIQELEKQANELQKTIKELKESI